MKMHDPRVRRIAGGGYIVDCDCGWSDPGVFSFEIGAVQAFVEHVVLDILADDTGAFMRSYEFDVSIDEADV